MIKGDQCCTAYEYLKTSSTLCGRWNSSEVPSWIATYGGYQFTCTDSQVRSARNQLQGKSSAMTLATSATTAAAALYFTAWLTNQITQFKSKISVSIS